MVKAKPDPYAVLRYANYRYFVLGRSFFTLAMQMQTVAVSWEIYQRLHMNTRGYYCLATALGGVISTALRQPLAAQTAPDVKRPSVDTHG